MADRPVVLAAVAGAHGVRGEVRLRLFTDSVDSIRRHPELAVRRGAGGGAESGSETLTLEAIRPAPGRQGGMAVARFAGIADRTAAEGLRGAELCVPRAALPPLPAGEYYWHDLIGRRVALPDGTLAGTVRTVENYGASDILVIVRTGDGERTGGGEVLVPFIPAAVTVPDDADAPADAPLVVGPEWLG